MTYGIVTFIGAVVVLAPNAPLVTILVGTQVLNAVLLVPLLFAMIGIGRDRALMGRFVIGRGMTAVYAVTTAVVVSCVVALGITTVLS